MLKNTILKLRLINQIIVKFIGEGCQARDEFQWIGKVIGFETNDSGYDVAIVKIIKHNFSYTDSRDKSNETEIYKFTLVGGYLQQVDGAWIIFD